MTTQFKKMYLVGKIIGEGAYASVRIAAIKAIKHPAGGGEGPAFSLVEKGMLTTDAARENFSLTEKAKEFLSYDPKPEFEEAGSAAEEAVVAE